MALSKYHKPRQSDIGTKRSSQQEPTSPRRKHAIRRSTVNYRRRENEIALEYRKLFRALRPGLPATNAPNNHASHARLSQIAAAATGAGSPARRPARFRFQPRHLAHAHQTPRASANRLDLLGGNARHRSRAQSLGRPRPTRRNRSRRRLRPLRRPHSVSLQSPSPSVEPDFLEEQ